jgi:hypothetical protein
MKVIQKSLVVKVSDLIKAIGIKNPFSASRKGFITEIEA